MSYSPTGSYPTGLTSPTDKRIGDAFPIIEEVYKHLPHLKYLAENANSLVAKQIELRGNTSLQSIEWAYQDTDEWFTLIAFTDLTGGINITELVDNLSQLLNDAKTYINNQINQSQALASQTQIWAQYAADNINRIGYDVPVAYSAGLVVNHHTFTVDYNGVLYSPLPSKIPFTTGAWDPSKWTLVQNLLNQKNLLVFDTYVEASAAAATLPDGQRVEIDADETRDGLGTLYNVGSGALVFVSYTEQLRQDIRESGGASLVGFDGETVASYFRSKNCRVVDSISELRALPKSTYARASATGYYSVGDGGGGDYWLDTADTTSADNGGSIIVAADGGRWKRADNRHDVKMFGAKGDHNGTTGTDDTDAIDRYLTWAMVAGVKAQFPSGLYQYSGSKLFDMAGSPGWTDGKRKFAITGESLSSTGIVYTGSAEYMWHIKGTYPVVDLFEISDMFFIGRGAAVNVATPFKLENLLLPEFRRLAFCGLKQAAWGSSITSVKWDQVLVTYCKQIGEFYRGLSPCNIMEFSNCEFTACNSAGSALTLSESVSIKFRSTGFEGNTAVAAIVRLINSGSDGVAGVDFDNCYFEGNKAIADVFINHINTCTYSFHQTTFNRTNATNYTTTNIYIDPVTLSAGGPECSLVISGGGFKSAGTYVPSPEKPSVVFALGDDGTYDGYTINDEGAVWTHAADKPVYPQKARLLNSRSRVKAAVRCTADGGIVSSYGVTGVTKTGTGVYVVTLAHGLDVTAIPQVTLFGTGFGFVNSDSGNTITVETHNTVGMATNLPFSLSVI